MRPPDDIERTDGVASVDDPEFPSGRWTGFYIQLGIRFRQDLDLLFREGRVCGTGIDSVGRFSVEGIYDVVTREVFWIKTYANAHSVDYRGFREIRGIWGTWELPGFRGGFQIWPWGERQAVADETFEEIEEELTVVTGVGCSPRGGDRDDEPGESPSRDDR